MSDAPFRLASQGADAPAPVLRQVSAQARLDGLLWQMTLRQTYRNTSPQPLEVVYTFPLQREAVLLGFASELNGQRMQGAIVERKTAEARYEAALSEGDAPVLLEALDDGLHTANIGNLAPGDEIVLEIRTAQVAAFDNGRIRLQIPTTIAPRFGDALAAGLQPQQVPQTSVLAEYPLALSVRIGHALAGATVECPTHRVAHRTDAEGTLLELRGAFLDRDVVIIATPQGEVPSVLVQALDARSDEAPVVALAACMPPLQPPRQAIALKLLVDCSGSMAGDSIASARHALKGAVDTLADEDLVSFSRFGDHVQHAVQAGRAGELRRPLRLQIQATEANLGGTQMQQALEQVFALAIEDRAGRADVLLVTDGEIWQADDMIAAARASGHRVFAIGVGSAPAQGVLRRLAEATGGACEFVTPGEDLIQASQRMMRRIRQPRLQPTRLDWGDGAVWQTELPQGVFAGDTVVAMAGLSKPATRVELHLCSEQASEETLAVRIESGSEPQADDVLPRLAAARRLATLEDAEQRELALRYQLMSEDTRCILVHERAAHEKVQGDAELHQVEQMLAAGWGASSSVDCDLDIRFCRSEGFADTSFALGAPPAPAAAEPAVSPSVWRMPKAAATKAVEALDHMVSDFMQPLYSRRTSTEASTEQATSKLPRLSRVDRRGLSVQPTLRGIAQSAAQFLADGNDFDAIHILWARTRLHPDLLQTLAEVQALGLSAVQSWLFVLQWVNDRTDGLGDQELGARLAGLAALVPAILAQQAKALIHKLLGAHGLDAWEEA